MPRYENGGEVRAGDIVAFLGPFACWRHGTIAEIAPAIKIVCKAEYELSVTPEEVLPDDVLRLSFRAEVAGEALHEPA